jgi:hypothetical protein
MFPVCLSCLSVLQVVAHRCRLPYVSFLHEIDGNGALLHGVELDLPPLFPREAPRRFFFWSSTDAECCNPYEDAVLHSLRFLHAIYGFAILDYNYTELGFYRQLARQLFSVANRGAHLARCVLTASEYGMPSSPQLVRRYSRVPPQVIHPCFPHL